METFKCGCTEVGPCAAHAAPALEHPPLRSLSEVQAERDRHVPNELDKQMEADYACDKALFRNAPTTKQIYALGWLKGRVAGLNAGMEKATIRESFNNDLYDDVRRTQRQTG